MRVLIASQVYGPAANGQSVFVAQLAEGLAVAGHEVTAVVPSRTRAPDSRVVNGVRLAELQAIPIGTDLGDAYFTPLPAAELRQLLPQVRPEIVHLQDHYPLCRWVFGMARRRQIPVIGTNHFLPENIVHYMYPFERGRGVVERWLWWTMKQLYDQLDYITTPSETAATILRRQGVRPPVSAISCGVDLSRYLAAEKTDRTATRQRFGLPTDQPLALYVGRIDEEKDLDVLLRGMAAKRQTCHLAIVGRGRHEAAIRGLAGQLGLEQYVTFTGYINERALPALLHASDLFVMPSPAELQSIATLEAMASGLPVLAANARALPELVEPGINGELFEPANPNDLAAKLDKLVAGQSRWEAMGAASLERVQAHRVSASVQAYAQLYQRVFRRHQARIPVLSAEARSPFGS